MRAGGGNTLPDSPQCYDFLREKDSKLDLTYLWLKYKKSNPDGYQFSLCIGMDAASVFNSGDGHLQDIYGL